MTTLTPIQSQAIARLLAGQTVAAVARELKIDRSTIYDWRQSKPEFRQALEEGRALLDELMADALADLAATAIDTLRQLLTSVITPPSVRLRAAESVLRAVAATRQAKPAASANKCLCSNRLASSKGPGPHSGIPHNPTQSDRSGSEGPEEDLPPGRAA